MTHATLRTAIIEAAAEYSKEYAELTKEIPFESKGIFTSELLMIVAFARKSGVTEIWESGRARGQSTEILACCLPDANIHSIELTDNSEDALVATERLKKYSNVELLYGDAIQLLPEKVAKSNKCLVLIDGPKGTEAIELAAKLHTADNVLAVFVHDFCKDSHLREKFEETFEEAFYTDDIEYAKRFEFLDTKCWEEHSKIGRYPYRRGNKQMLSYSSTLAAIVNEKYDYNTYLR